VAVVDEIAVKLGVQTGDLKAALNDASATIKKFGQDGSKDTEGFGESIKGIHKGMRELKEVFAVGGALEAVKGFFEKAISYANEHKEDTDENTEAVRRFGESYESISGLVTKASVQTLGFLNRAGEAWGNLIAYVANGGEKAMKAIEVTEDAERNLAKIAEQRKQTQKEIAEVDGKLADAEQKKKDAAFETLTVQQKLDDVYQRIVTTTITLKTTAEGTLAHEKAKLDLLNLEAESTKLEAERAKQVAEDKKKADEEQVQRNQKLALDEKSMLDMFELQRKSAMGLTQEESNRLKLYQLETEEKKVHLDIADLEAKLIQGKLTPADKDRLDQLISQDKKLVDQITHLTQLTTGTKEQVKAEKEVTTEVQKQADLLQHGDKLISQRDQGAKDYRNQLEQQSSDLTKQIKDNQELITAELLRAGTENDTTISIRQQNDELEHQLDTVKNIVHEMDRSWEKVWSPLGLHNLGSYSSDVLQAKLKQLQDQAAQEKQDWDRSGASAVLGATGSTFENTHYDLFSQIGSVQAELQFRQTIQSAFARGGRSGALQAFLSNGGDALSFDTAFANMNSWSSGNNQQANQLDSINGKLGAINGTLQSVFQTNTPQLTR
jgi:hypothetical protein